MTERISTLQSSSYSKIIEQAGAELHISCMYNVLTILIVSTILSSHDFYSLQHVVSVFLTIITNTNVGQELQCCFKQFSQLKTRLADPGQQELLTRKHGEICGGNNIIDESIIHHLHCSEFDFYLMRVKRK